MLTAQQVQFLQAGGAVPKGAVACCFARGRGPWRFSDSLYLYADGRLRLERCCHGEAAGVVFSAWGSLQAEGVLTWENLPGNAADVPQRITGLTQAPALTLDDKPAEWLCQDVLKTDKAHGYGFWKRKK